MLDRDAVPLRPRHDAGLTSLAVVARFHGKAVDPEQLRHELGVGAAACADDLLRAARRLGFKAVLDTLDLRRTRMPLPCIVEVKGGGFAVLAKLEGTRALIHEDGRPQAQELDVLTERLTGRALLVASRAPETTLSARFGFGWFLLAITKYRS